MSKVQFTNRPNARSKWMGSGSVIAAAAAFAAGTGAETAHARQDMTMPRVHSVAPDILTTRQLIQRSAPGEVHRDAVSVPSVQRQPATPMVLPNATTNPIAPVIEPEVVIAPVPVTPSVIVAPATNTPISAQTTQPTMAAVVDNPGNNVLAFASYDDTQIDFSAGALADVVTVLANSAIIDWTTFTAGADGTEVTFLGAGSNLNFTSSLGDYTVLNRIFTPGFDSAVRIDGNVTSTVIGGSAIGGNVWFYSPGGLVIGSSATFNIGSLLLSTSDINAIDVGVGDFDVSFQGTSNPNSAIRVESGATINALENNSYVAMVAPRIEQGGDVRVNGSTAYVAAEQATMTIRNGLFDISVDVGSEDANGIVHTGSTGGPNSTGVTDEQAIYFVAVPKNTAINMLVGGSVGYDAATAATIENGQIILTTGNRVERDESLALVSNPGGGSTGVEISLNTVDTTIDGGPAGNITVEGATFTSSAQLFAEDTLTIRSLSAQSTVGAVDLDLTAGDTLNLSVANGDLLAVSGDLDMTAGDGVAQGGNINIDVSGSGTTMGGGGGGPVVIGSGSLQGIVVDGNMSVQTRARGLDDFFTFRNNGGNGIGQDAVAGNIALNISNNGSLSVGGTLTLDASAQGGKGEVQNGSATAGSVQIDLASGSLFAGTGVNISTEAIRANSGKIGGNGIGLLGSSSTAGDVTINLLGGTSSLGVVNVVSDSGASSGSDETAAQSNDAVGSDFTLNVSGGVHNMARLNVRNSVDSGTSYDGVSTDSFAGLATRGTSAISVTNADTSLLITGDLVLSGSVRGDTGVPVGDTVSISVIDTGTGTGAGLNIGGELNVNTSAREGRLGGLTQSGSIFLSANNGTFTTNDLTLFASAGDSFSFGPELAGSDFQGGDISIVANNGGAFTVVQNSFIDSAAVGLINSNFDGSGIGQGGTISILADDGSVGFGGFTFLNADGFALSGVNLSGQAGQGLGGTIRATVQGSSGDLSFGTLDMSTDGAVDFGSEEFFPSFTGAGSAGSGGLTEINVLGGTFSANSISISSSGIGGPGGDIPESSLRADPDDDKRRSAAVMNGLPSAGNGGAGIGGDVVFNLDGGAATVANLTISANGIGGSGAFGDIFNNTNGGTGGTATGGTATFNANSGSLNVTGTLRVEATGNEQISGFVFGGSGGDGNGTGGGDGGTAQGGTAIFNLDGTAAVNVDTAIISTEAFGGRAGSSSATFSGDPDMGGGDGGDATGGVASFNDTSGDIVFNSLTVNASGRGGAGGDSFGVSTGDASADGGAGGTGTGGTARIDLNQNSGSARAFSAIAQGSGGSGGGGANGGSGGLGQGGNAILAVNDVDVALDQVTLDSSAAGGQAGFIDGPGLVAGATGGSAIGGNSVLQVSGTGAGITFSGQVDLLAGATGADGGFGASSQTDADQGGAGGTGGDASGGNAGVEVSDGADIVIEALDFNFNADATGGTGGNGGSNFFGGGSGDGGQGGDATGGTVAITARSGATVELFNDTPLFAMSSTGTGGAGGSGGGIDMVSGGIAGAGGNGGNGTGGAPTISAIGATIITDGVDMELTANGLGGAGGLGGDDGTGPIGAMGAGGNGAGGAPVIEVVEGSPGIISVDGVTITASGTGGTGITAGSGLGGQVTIRDLSTDPAGLISMGDLDIDATGATGTSTGLLTISSGSGAITVDGDVDATVSGTMNFDFSGDGQLVVTGGVDLSASDNINVTHSGNQAGLVSIDIGNTLDAVAGLDFAADPDAILNVVNAVNITGENITYDDIISDSTVVLTATDGSITGASTGIISASGVVDAITLTAAQDVTFGNLISLNGNIDIDAGNAITGVDADAAQFIEWLAGGLVAVDTVTSASLATIDAGSVDIETFNPGFIANITTNIGDLDIGAINASSTVDLDSAASVIVGTAASGSFVANGVDDVTLGTLTTTGGVADVTINAGGTATYTNIDSDRLVRIIATDIVGGDMNVDATATLTADSIDIGSITVDEVGNIDLDATNGDLSTGALAGNIINADTTGDLTVGNVDANSVRLVAGGNAALSDITSSALTLLVSGNLVAADLSGSSTLATTNITVGGDADIASVLVNNILNLNVTGALTGGSFTGAGALSLMNIDAGSVDIDSVESTNQNIDIAVTSGDVTVGTVISGLSTVITGDNITLDSGTVGNSLRLNAINGGIFGNGSITVTNTADFDATGDIAIGSLDAASIQLASGGDLLFDALTSPNTIELTALNGAIGANTTGLGDITSGGTVDLTALTMALGDIDSVGDINADATGGDAAFGDLNSGQSITITATGTPSLASVTSVGNTNITGASVALDGGDIGGSLFIDAQAGDIDISLDGDEQLIVGSGASFFATGDMTVTHTNNTNSVFSIDAGGGIVAIVDGNFLSDTGSILNSSNEIIIDTIGSITADDLRAVPGIELTAGGNVTLNNAVATGPQGVSNLSGITINAGLIAVGSPLFDNNANATITGTVTSYADININAGGNAVFAAGSQTSADNALNVLTGDDIIIEAGALLTSANAPTTPIVPAAPFASGPNLSLNAGGLPNLLSVPNTPIASIVIDGTLDANDAAIILNANAIDGRNSALIAGSIQADVRDAPLSTMSLSDDAGLLSSPCLEGMVCLNTMDATNLIAIGQNSNNDVIRLFIDQATVNATDILITTREDIVMGTTGIDTVLNASGTFSATSNTGNVDLRDASISANQILIDAAGSLLGTASLSSTNDIGIDVGGSIFASSIVTDGELTNVADVGGATEGFYTVDGDFVVGLLAYGSTDINIDAVGSISISQADTPNSVFLTSGSDVFLGFADVPGDIDISGATASFDTLNAAGSIFVDAMAGSIDAVGATANAGDSISLTASGDITSDDLDAQGGGITVDASDGLVSLGDVTAADDIIVDAGNGTIDLGTSTTVNGNVTLTATDAITSGAISSDTGIFISGAAFTGTTLVTRTSVNINTDIGDVAFDTLQSDNAVTIDSAGDLTANAINAGIGMLLGAGGDITLGAADAGDGLFDASAGGSFTADSIISTQTTDFPSQIFAGGDITIGTLEAFNSDLTAGGAVFVTDDAIITDILVASGTAVTLNATGNLSFNATASDGDITVITGGDMDAQGADATGNIYLESTGGSVTANEVFARPGFSNTPLPKGASGNITSSGGNITIIAAGDFIVNSVVSASNDLFIDIGGLFTLDALASGQNIQAIVGDIDITANGQLGEADRTQLIEIFSPDDAVLGGAGGTGAPFELDNDELSRVHSGGDLAIVSDGTLSVDTLDVAVGAGSSPTDGNIGAGGGLFLESLSVVSVIGSLTVTNASADNFLGIDAGDEINIDFDNGNIRMEDANGAPIGEIGMTATFISAISNSAAGDIAGASVDDIDVRLATNDGAVRDEGFIQSGGITFNVEDGLLIQNTGAGTDFDNRRGLTADALTINNDNATGSVITIVINGVVAGQTGIDAIAPTTISGTFDAASTINGCQIADPASCAVVVTPSPNPTPNPNPNPNPNPQPPVSSPNPTDDPTRDVIEEGLDPKDTPQDAGSISAGLLEFTPNSEFGTDPLIDEPVTGAGNEDLWVDPDCPPGSEEEACSLEPAE